MTSLLSGARKMVTRGTDLGARIEGLDGATTAARGRLDDALVDEARATVDRASGRLRLSAEHTVVALAGATGLGQVLDVQRADRAGAVRGRRAPPDHVLDHRLRLGARRGRRAAGVARHPRPAPGHPGLDAGRRPPPGRGGAGRRRPARPARPRLHRGVPPPRGGPARRPRRPAGLGPRPAEVRRRRDPRPLPRAAGQPPGRDAGRPQPHRHRAGGAAPGHGRRRTPPARPRRAARRAGGRGQRPARHRHRGAAQRDRPPGVGQEGHPAADRGGPARGRRPARRGLGLRADPRALGRAGGRARRRVRRGRGRADRGGRRRALHPAAGGARHRLAGDLVALPAQARPAQAPAPRPRRRRQAAVRSVAHLPAPDRPDRAGPGGHRGARARRRRVRRPGQAVGRRGAAGVREPAARPR